MCNFDNFHAVLDVADDVVGKRGDGYELGLHGLANVEQRLEQDWGAS